MAKVLGENIEGQTPVWRYMSFSKFAALIIQSEMFMSRADKLEDLFEGAISKEAFEMYMEQLKPHFEGWEKV